MGRVRSGLRRLRARTSDALRPGEDGFTLIEMMVAISILAVTMMTVAYGLFGGMRVLQAGRHETSFLELANAEAERIRALDYEDAGVNGGTADGVAPDPDPNLNAAYPPVGGVNKFNGRDAVIISPPSAEALPAVEVVSADTTSNRPKPYTIRRWVTWTDPAAGTSQRFKRIDVTIEWTEPNGRARSVSYTTLYYPGNLGPVENQPPVAQFTSSPTSGFAGSTSFAFNATASTDPNGLALTYDWDFGDGTTATGPTTAHTYATVGRKTVRLVVTNSAGVNSSPVSQNILVGTAPGTPAPPGNLPPVASFVATPTTDVGPLSVSVDASASSDPNGDPLTYTWTWGDGTPNGAGSAAGHVYNDAGSYNLFLTVTDPAGATASTSTTITVTSITCAVQSASFRNPSTNAVANDIQIANSDRPVNSGFLFTATTNPSCTAMTAALPTQAAPFTATLVLQSTTATTKTWAVSTTNDSKYNTGTAQSATFTATGDAGLVPFTVSFSVHD